MKFRCLKFGDLKHAISRGHDSLNPINNLLSITPLRVLYLLNERKVVFLLVPMLFQLQGQYCGIIRIRGGSVFVE